MMACDGRDGDDTEKKKKQQPLNVKHLGFPSVAISLVLLSFYLSFPFRFSVSSSVRSCVCARACVSCFFTLSVCWSIVGFFIFEKKKTKQKREKNNTHTHTQENKKIFRSSIVFFVRVCARWGLLLLLFAPPPPPPPPPTSAVSVLSPRNVGHAPPQPPAPPLGPLGPAPFPLPPDYSDITDACRVIHERARIQTRHHTFLLTCNK